MNRLARLTLVFSVLLAFFIVSPAVFHQEFGPYSLMEIGDVIDLFTRSWWYLALGAIFSLLFMTTHRRETDDHLVIKERWSGLRRFLTMPPRK